MGLTQKILVFTSLLVVALVGATLAFTTVQADRLAHETIHQGLSETREVWETFQADRYNKLKLGIRVLGNDPAFKSLVETNDQATILDTLRERGQELNADFFIATDPAGRVIARTDRPGAQGEDLSKDPLVTKPLEGEESATVWRQGDRLYHAVSVPMQTGPDMKGVLIAGYAINEGLASRIRTSLVLVSLAVMVVALVIAYFVASRITGPVRHLAGLVERARNGSYSGAVTVDTRDEIGVLARTFNRLLADLREKEQLIGFLREGMTTLRKGAPGG